MVSGATTHIAIQDLRERGLVNVNYPDVLRGAVEKAVDSWKFFCQLPREEKLAFEFLEDSHGDGAGYELKVADGTDRKENFHVSLFQSKRLQKIANQRSLAFLTDAQDLLDKMEPLILQFAECVEQAYDIQGFKDEVKMCKQYWMLRYLHYFGDQKEGIEIAAPHTDKGGFTLHLYETDEGLQYFCIPSRQWKPMPVDKQQTVIISGLQLQLASEGRIKALYHRVIATEKSASIGRFAVVCFISLENRPGYNKKGYGNTQSHQVGFNYDLPHPEFAKYFLKR